MNKICASIFLIVVLVGASLGILLSFPTPTFALPSFLTPNCTATTCPFTFLAPISFPGFNITNGTTDVGGEGASRYLAGLYTFGIAVASALAVIMIVIGGVQYSSTDAIQGKSAGKDKIYAAITGLLLALISYTILNTINVNLVSNSFSPKSISVTPNPETGGGAVEVVPGAGTGVLGTWDETERNSYYSSLANGTRSADGRLIISTYGYDDDPNADPQTRARRGDRDNFLTEGSVAISPDLKSKYNPAPGSAVYVNDKLIGYYDDSTPSNYKGTSIVNTIDVYDPNKKLGEQLKNINSGSYTLRFGEVRPQQHNPSN